MNEQELCEPHQVYILFLTGVLLLVPVHLVIYELYACTTATLDDGSCKMSIKRKRKNKNRVSHTFSHDLDRLPLTPDATQAVPLGP